MSAEQGKKQSAGDEAPISSPEIPSPRQGHHIVALGASAGGLESLERFFDQMPSQAGISFVVIQHLSPDYKSLMVELLSKHTSMAVQRAENDLIVKPNHVYLIPARTTMKIQHGRLKLFEQDPSTLHLPIDTFFESLGKDQRDKAVGIVLSGTGSDGMRGIRSIKEAGGMVMVQAVADAKFDGMPRSAISTGLPDFVLPADELPSALMNFIENPGLLGETEDPTDLYQNQQEAMDRIISAVNRLTGVDFTFYKPATIVRRVERRLNINQCGSLDEYADLVEQSDEEVLTLYKELLIGVTRFFRDEEAFEVLRHQVIPQIVERNPDDPIRVWGAGCSTGEEAYSLAMLFVEHLEANDLHRNVMIFATDLDREAVEYAAEGAYPESIVADLSPERLNRFFVKRNEKYYIKRQLREMIIFAPQNITKDPPFSNMDLVCCRNLLIYLQPAMQKRVLSLMAYSLKHQGFLLLGSSETLGESVSVFRAVDARQKVYQKVSSSRRLINETLSVSRIRRDLGKSQPHPAQAKTGSADTSDTDVLQSALQELMHSRQSCAVILDESCIIRHVFGRTENIIQLQPGKASLDARKIMNHDLSIALSTAVSRAGKTGQEVVYARIQLPDQSVAVNLRVRPLAGDGPTRLFLGLFEQAPLAAARTGPDQVPPEGDSNERIRDLEQELQFTKANLQSTIEELQTSNEELQATNEELVTSNEELQSTNEELQSVNEELHTVNSEYQEKIEELTQLNNDMDNLLRATQIGVLFLDNDLQIRKFTPKVAEVINILSQDIGRPVNHITCKAPDLDLVARCREAIEFGVPDLQEIHLPDEQVYMARFVPYWTGEDQLDGLVVTFVEVTAVHMDRARHQSLLEITQEEIAVLDPEGRIIQINPAWRQMVENVQSDGRLTLGADFIEQSLPDLMDETDGASAPEWEMPLREVLANRRDAWSLDLKIKPDRNPRRLTATSLSGHERGAIIRLTRLAPG